uniref:AT-rich interactive domain-containing protein 5B n=1 Tax=Magallana gigas TaxID=29159 RepID=K1Q8S6_MAGGI
MDEQNVEDEILAMSEKLILKAGDLVPLLIENVTWTFGRPLCQEESLSPHKEEFRNIFVCNKKGLNFSDVEKEKEKIDDKGDLTSTPLTILSFAQYCRYRTVLKRLENMVDKWLRNAIICAIGGIVTKSKNARIMFCKTTVDVPELDDLEIRCDHLAPSLKGRPRKKKSLTRSDSDSYETSSDISTPGGRKDVLIGKRESALRNGLKFDNSQVSAEEQEFLFNLHCFMKRRNTPISRIPSLGFKQGDTEEVMETPLRQTRRKSRKYKCCHLYSKALRKKHSKHHKEEPSTTHREDNSCMTPTEDGFSKPRRRFKTTLTLRQRAEQWEQIRKLKERQKAIKGRKPGRPRTVKNLLDSSEKEKTQALSYTSIKTEISSREETEDAPGDRLEGSVMIKEEKESVSDSESHVQTVFSQSKLFQQNSVQGSSSTSMNHSNAMERDVSNIPVHQAALFYPQTFVPLGGLHPMGLPLMNQLPMGIPRFHNHPLFSPASSEKQQQSYRPNILRNSQKTPQEIRSAHASSKSSGYPLSKSVDPSPSRQTSNMSPASSSAASSPKTLMVPPAHSNGLKRSFSTNHQKVSTASAPNFANKSLLFDFESPKRQKLDVAAINSSECSDEPTDLSMKTLKKRTGSDNVERTGTPSRDTPENLSNRERSPSRSRPPVHSSPAGSEAPTDIPHSVFSKRPSSVFNTSPTSLSSSMVELSNGPSTPSQSQEGLRSMKFESQDLRKSRSAIKGSESFSSSMKAAGLPELPPGMVHPAFLHPMMRPSVPIPQSGYFPIPLQLQQLYQAQLRASAAYDGLLQRDHASFSGVPLPMFVPQMPLYSQRDKK